MADFGNLKVSTGDTITAAKWNNLVGILEEHELKIQDFSEGPLRIETERPEGGDAIKYKVVIANDVLPGGDETGTKVESSLNFGADVRQMINLWKEEYGIGVQNNTVYCRSHQGFAWFSKGKHHSSQYNAGQGGKLLMTLDQDGLKVPKGNLTVENNGGALKLEGTNHVYLELYPRARGGGRKAWMGFGSSNTKDMCLSNEDEGKLILRSKNDMDFQLGGKLKIGGNAAIMFKTFNLGVEGGSDILSNTKITSDTYHAAIVGFSTGSADIDESGRDATLLQVRMISRKPLLQSQAAPTWHISVALKSHPSPGTQKHAKWTIDVMFIRKELCE